MTHCHVLVFYAMEIDICDAALASNCGVTISENSIYTWRLQHHWQLRSVTLKLDSHCWERHQTVWEHFAKIWYCTTAQHPVCYQSVRLQCAVNRLHQLWGRLLLIVKEGQKIELYRIYGGFFERNEQVAGWPSGLRRQFKALVFGRGFESHFSHENMFFETRLLPFESSVTMVSKTVPDGKEYFRRSWRPPCVMWDIKRIWPTEGTTVGNMCYRTVNNPCVLKIVWTFNCFSRAPGSNPNSWWKISDLRSKSTLEQLTLKRYTHPNPKRVVVYNVDPEWPSFFLTSQGSFRVKIIDYPYTLS